jgi:hypothetical protein
MRRSRRKAGPSKKIAVDREMMEDNLMKPAMKVILAAAATALAATALAATALAATARAMKDLRAAEVAETARAARALE